MRTSSRQQALPAHQADATLSQANPVSGTKYTLLDTCKNCRIIGIMAKVTWTVQPTPLEVHVTIDGQTITHTKTNPASATNHFAEVWQGAAEDAQGLPDTDIGMRRNWVYEGRSIKIEVETTGGTVSSLDARVKYAKW